MAGVKAKKMRPEVRKKWMAARVTHGAYAAGGEKAEHYIWRGMLRRCNTPTDKSYPYYGERGVTVCKRWCVYENFYLDMGDRPSKNHSLNRVDNNKGYTPTNCQWATRSTQQKNKRNTKMYTNGVFTGTLVECAEYLGVTKNCAFERWKTWGSFQKGKLWLLQREL